MGISFFAFCATSLMRSEIPRGTIYIGDAYNIKLPKDSVIASILRLGYNCDFYEGDSAVVDSVIRPVTYLAPYYQTDNIIRTYGDSIISDTTASVKYRLEEVKPNRTRLTIINVTFPQEGNIQDWRTLKHLSEQYSRWLNQNWIEKVK